MRDYDGRPLAGMMPRVSEPTGAVLAPGMITVLTHRFPAEVTAHFRFLVQKTADPRTTREDGLAFLGADYYQEPELFSDRLAAVFPQGSATAARLIGRKTVLLDFEQFSQSFRMFATAKALATDNEAREAALWHNRLFNRNLANDAVVLGFDPDWDTAQAEPMH